MSTQARCEAFLRNSTLIVTSFLLLACNAPAGDTPSATSSGPASGNSSTQLDSTNSASADCARPRSRGGSGSSTSSSGVASGSSSSSSGGDVCNPFGSSSSSGTVADASHGIAGKLWYLDASQPRYDHVYEYERYGHAASTTVWLNQFDIPTEMFTQGFSDRDGNQLKDARGNPLIEYFALHFESVLKLTARDKPGKYQFAVLSDDGAIFSAQINNAPKRNWFWGWRDWGSPIASDDGFSVVVANDGNHETRMGCADYGVELEAGASLPIKLDYFQGPRYNIALVLLWRRVTDDDCFFWLNDFDSFCGVEGNDAFWNPATEPSKPEDRFLDLLSRGWSVVPAENFYLPDASAGTSTSNPCAPGGGGSSSSSSSSGSGSSGSSSGSSSSSSSGATSSGGASSSSSSSSSSSGATSSGGTGASSSGSSSSGSGGTSSGGASSSGATSSSGSTSGSSSGSSSSSSSSGSTSSSGSSSGSGATSSSSSSGSTSSSSSSSGFGGGGLLGN